MNKADYQEILKQLLDQMREDTLLHLLNHDEQYLKEAELEGEAEQAYMQLDLDSNSKEIVDRYINCINNVYSDYSSLSYLAGVVDSLKILSGYGLLK